MPENRAPHLVKFARCNRKEATVPEKLLWARLRGRRDFGIHWRRQEVIGNYIVDFFCHRVRLVVELDGQSHMAPGQYERDMERQAFLLAQGFTVVRYWNDDVVRDPGSVADSVWSVVENLLSESS